MARGKHGRNDNLNGNKQGIQVKTDGPTILKLILISVHSQLETEERVFGIQAMTTEALKALRCTHV